MPFNTRRDSPWLALILLMAINTVGFIDRIVVNVLVEPIKGEFQLSDTQVSLMGTAFTLLNVGVALIIARYAERARRLSLIAAGTLFWSVATAACGWAVSWTQLLLARMGVGLGEAIGLPSNQSVLSDYFPPSKRGLAISILMLAPPIGAFVGFVGGGWIAQEFDWRSTFLIAAIPGLVLALLAWLFVAEPPRGRYDKVVTDEVPPMKAVLHRLFVLPSARNLVIGSSLAAMLGFGLNYFFTSLMMRQFGVGLAEAGLYSGIIASLPAAISVVGSGWLGDKLGAKNPAAYALIPAVCLIVGGPLYVFAITRESLGLLLGLISIATFLNFGYLGITYAALQNLMHPRMRVSTFAVLNVVYGVASALGPFLLGWLSDHMAASFGPAQGLSVAMAITGALYVWAGLHYLLASRHLARDVAAVAEK
ncbi:MFS transporter [Croceibacterium sp. LX-88]|jgi:MFS family permease|uniref:MFS transporter n=1 Tax=Croceibacterium selenioxidans TaxID=2838833 RepID=A0ABS5W7C8_9SPHN|nr:MFS transporter [Croceibacterium selenioxidans]MBT2135604.1 MFS transporter [Croceibacterium selenioxidans]